MSGLPLLSLAIWVPIVSGLVVLATGSDRNAPLAKMLALLGGIAGLMVTLPLYTQFDLTTSAMQFVELSAWIPRFNINYHLGVDGISMLFVILNSFITVIVVLAGWKVIDKKVAQYHAGFLIMSGLLNGIFASLDGMLFYVFFEASLIPLYLVIGVWWSKSRLCCVQVLPIHLNGVIVISSSNDLSLYSVGWKLLHSRLASAADR